MLSVIFVIHNGTQFDYEKEYLPQLEENLVWLGAELQKLTDYQQRRNTYRKK